ncbi:MAG: hypothetical protein MUE67_12660 [Anaerolineales bacterium]|nr:hypothetical protein [Anaerolineales bacterium]
MTSTPILFSKYFSALAGLLLCLAALAGCSVPEAIVAQAPSGEVLFRDDFSSSASGWDQVKAASGETDYQAGFYRIWVNEPYLDLWANPGLGFGDVRLEAEAKKAAGPDDNLFGLICRSNEAGDQYYYFVISSDGYYGIGKVSGQDQKLLSAEKMMPSEAILPGGRTNRLRADCIGERLAFYVNDQLLAEVQDLEYARGDVGLTAGTFEQAGVDIYFDNLVVTKP